jgi:hypothetical protein
MEFLFASYALTNLDTSNLDYDYAGYVSRTGKILLIRYNKAATEVRYYQTTGDYDTIWADRLNKTYVLPHEIEGN